MITRVLLLSILALNFNSLPIAEAAANCPVEVSQRYNELLKKFTVYENTQTNFIMPPLFENYCRSHPAYRTRDQQQFDNLQEYYNRVVAPDTIVPDQMMEAAKGMILCGEMTDSELVVLAERVAKRAGKYIDSGYTQYDGKMKSMSTRFMPYLTSSLRLIQAMKHLDSELAIQYYQQVIILIDQYYNELIRQVREEHDFRYTREVFIDILRIILLGGMEYDLHEKLVQLGKAMGFELQVQNRAFFQADDITWQYLTLIDNHPFHFTPGGGNIPLDWQQTGYVARVDYKSGKLVSTDGMVATLTAPAAFVSKFKIQIEACEATPKLFVFLEKFGAEREMYHFETEDEEMDYPFQSILDSWSKSIFVNNNLAVFENTNEFSNRNPFVALKFETGLINRNPKVGDDIYEGPMPGMPEMKTRLKIDLYHKPQ